MADTVRNLASVSKRQLIFFFGVECRLLYTRSGVQRSPVCSHRERHLIEACCSDSLLAIGRRRKSSPVNDGDREIPASRNARLSPPRDNLESVAQKKSVPPQTATDLEGRNERIPLPATRNVLILCGAEVDDHLVNIYDA